MLPRPDGFFTGFIMSIIMFITRKPSVETMICWIDQPCLVPLASGLRAATTTLLTLIAQRLNLCGRGGCTISLLLGSILAHMPSNRR